MTTIDREIYEPRLLTAANITISHTITAARKRIISTIRNPITTTHTATLSQCHSQRCSHSDHKVNGYKYCTMESAGNYHSSAN